MERRIRTVERKEKMKTMLYIALPVMLIALFLALFAVNSQKRKEAQRKQVVIAVPYSGLVQDYDSNYYTRWLEEKTGYDIKFSFLEEGYEKENLRTMLMSGSGNVDAVFLLPDQNLISHAEYQEYIRAGYLLAPQELLGTDSNLSRLRETYPEIEFGGLLGEDGYFYCFPSVKVSRTDQNMQVLWVNIDWLTNLNLTMPRTTQEFQEMLETFRDGDPNGNGRKDELPLVSCEAGETFQSYRYLLNAFTYYDGMTLPGYGEEGGTEKTAAFREGITFCADLYGKNLLVRDSFPYTEKQLTELINDPADTVGAFASHSIADVVYTNNPGILAHFMQLAPLASPTLERGYAVRTDIFPDIGGLIPADARHGREAAQVMDLMLSKEASLIALYGEENTDWRFSRDGELSTYGVRASVTTIRYMKGERQNKNYAGVGPLAAAAEYLDGVTWNGDHSMTEYIDARAVKSYAAYYYPEKTDQTGSAGKITQKSGAQEYLEREILRFITGERKIEKDEDWEDFVAGYAEMTGQSI